MQNKRLTKDILRLEIVNSFFIDFTNEIFFSKKSLKRSKVPSKLIESSRFEFQYLKIIM